MTVQEIPPAQGLTRTSRENQVVSSASPFLKNGKNRNTGFTAVCNVHAGMAPNNLAQFALRAFLVHRTQAEPSRAERLERWASRYVPISRGDCAYQNLGGVSTLAPPADDGKILVTPRNANIPGNLQVRQSDRFD
jgi:hypothetical protein